jgi:hypothetical protein
MQDKHLEYRRKKAKQTTTYIHIDIQRSTLFETCVLVVRVYHENVAAIVDYVQSRSMKHIRVVFIVIE